MNYSIVFGQVQSQPQWNLTWWSNIGLVWASRPYVASLTTHSVLFYFDLSKYLPSFWLQHTGDFYHLAIKITKENRRWLATAAILVTHLLLLKYQSCICFVCKKPGRTTLGRKWVLSAPRESHSHAKWLIKDLYPRSDHWRRTSDRQLSVSEQPSRSLLPEFCLETGNDVTTHQCYLPNDSRSMGGGDLCSVSGRPTRTLTIQREEQTKVRHLCWCFQCRQDPSMSWVSPNREWVLPQRQGRRGN